MRHRSSLLTGLALALACGLTLAGCGDLASDGAGASEAAATAEPTTEIPDDFPLAAGMGGPADAIETARTGTGLRDVAVCGTTPLRGLGIRDRMVADNSGGEAANTRELVLLGNPDEAHLVAEAFTDLAHSCEADTVEGQPGMEIRTEVRDSPFGPTPAATLVQTYTFDGEPGTGATVIHVVPVGASVLVTSTYGQWGEGSLEDGVTSTVDALQDTVAAQAMFGDGAAPTDEPAASPTEPAYEIPADFPLAVGLPEDGGDFRVGEPSADGAGVGEVEMCGRVVWPAADTDGGTRRLVVGAEGPEFYEGHELLVHADADAAVDAMEAIRRAARDCREAGTQVWTPLERDTGYDTVTMGLTWSTGLGSSVYQVTRIGAGRLLVTTYGEGTLDSLAQQADDVTQTTTSILPAMCVFTKTGC